MNRVQPSPEPTGMSGIDTVVESICQAAVERRGDVDTVVGDLVDRMAPLSSDSDRRHLHRLAVARLTGLDRLAALLDDPSVDEVMVNRGVEVWADRHGRLVRQSDLTEGTVDTILERVLAPLGRRLDRHAPIVDARLPDGARLCAVISPVAVDGTSVSIRRHRPRHVGLDSFASPAVADLVRGLLVSRANILVTGATSTGKTTLLSTLVDLLPPAERLVVVEDTAELSLVGRHAVRLETRAGTVDGPGAVDAADLVRTALRLRPDRLVVGEFRGPEAVSVIEALNTGHDGSLSTCHANSAADGLRRLETLLMQAVPTWPLAAIRRQVTRTIDSVIHLQRRADGHRHIVEVVEVVESDGEPGGRALIESDDVIAEPFRSRR